MISKVSGYSIVLKGKEKDIKAAVKELKGEGTVLEKEMLSDKMSQIKYIFYGKTLNIDKYSLFHNKAIKYAFLGQDEDRSDIAIFKDFNSDELETFYPYTEKYMSVFAEELEGYNFFLDETFKEDYEDYSCGEIVTIEYTCPIKEKWNDDSAFDDN